MKRPKLEELTLTEKNISVAYGAAERYGVQAGRRMRR